MVKILLLLLVLSSDSSKPYTFRNDTLYINYWHAVNEDYLKYYLDVVDKYQPKVVWLRVETYGGDPFAAMDFVLTVREKYELITQSNGLVASAGLLLFLGGDKRVASKYTLFLIHDIKTLTIGFLSSSDSRKQAEDMAKIQNVINKFIAERTGLDVDVVDSLSMRESWLTGKEALRFNFVTEVKE